MVERLANACLSISLGELLRGLSLFVGVIVYEIRLAEAVPQAVFGECMGKAVKVARMRGLRSCSPSLDGSSIAQGGKSSDCWRIIKASKRYIDILCGVLAGEGHLVVVQEMPNPWERKRARQYGRLSLENLKSSASPSSLAEEPDDGLHGPGDELS